MSKTYLKSKKKLYKNIVNTSQAKTKQREINKSRTKSKSKFMDTLFNIIRDNSLPKKKPDFASKIFSKNQDNSLQVYLHKLENKYQWEKTNNFLLNYNGHQELTNSITKSLKQKGKLWEVFKTKSITNLVKKLFEIFEDVIEIISKR